MKTPHAAAAHLTFQEKPDGTYTTDYFSASTPFRFKASDLFAVEDYFTLDLDNLRAKIPKFSQFSVRYVYAEIGQDMIISPTLNLQSQIFQFLNPKACDHITFSICFAVKKKQNNQGKNDTVLLTESGLLSFYESKANLDDFNIYSKVFQPKVFSNYQTKSTTDMMSILPSSIIEIINEINSKFNAPWDVVRDEVKCKSALHYSSSSHYLRPNKERESFANSPITDLLNSNHFFFKNESSFKKQEEKVNAIMTEFDLLVSRVDLAVKNGVDYRNEFTFNIQMGKFSQGDLDGPDNEEKLIDILDTLQFDLEHAMQENLIHFHTIPSKIFPGSISVLTRHFWSATKDLLNVFKIQSENYKMNPRQYTFLMLMELLLYSTINVDADKLNLNFFKLIGLTDSIEKGFPHIKSEFVSPSSREVISYIDHDYVRNTILYLRKPMEIKKPYIQLHKLYERSRLLKTQFEYCFENSPNLNINRDLYRSKVITKVFLLTNRFNALV